MSSLEYIKRNIKLYEHEIFFALSVVLVGFIGYGLGRLSRLDENKTPIVIREDASLFAGTSSSVGGKIVASKSGSTYHFPWCPGAKKIGDANKIWFDSQIEAERAGYKKALNCKGL